MKTQFIKAMILLLGILIIFSCKKEEELKESKKTEIIIGLLIPETGGAVSTGESTNTAINIALKDIKQYLSDIDSDKTIKLIIEDTQTDTIVALQKLISFKEKGVQLVIGPFTSAAVKTIKDYADLNDILIISPASVATSLAIPDDNIFRLVPSDISQGEAMTALLNDDSIEVLLPIIRDDLWGNELLATLSQQFTNSKNSVITPIKYIPSTIAFISYIYQLKLNLNDALSQYPANKIGVYMASFGEGTDILEEATNEATLYKVKWYGSSGYAGFSSLPLDLEAAGFANTQSLLCPVFGYDEDAKDKWQPLIDKIEVQIGRKPEIYALVSYDALWLATLTYLTTGLKVSTDDLITAFVYEANNYFGVTGRTALNAAGDRAFATYDFWGIDYNYSDYSWQVVAKYNNATGQLVSLNYS